MCPQNLPQLCGYFCSPCCLYPAVSVYLVDRLPHAVSVHPAHPHAPVQLEAIPPLLQVHGARDGVVVGLW